MGDCVSRVMGDIEPNDEHRPSDPLRTGDMDELNDRHFALGDWKVRDSPSTLDWAALMISGDVGAGLRQSSISSRKL